jgi:starch synthase (maltosyl-transferring)
MLSVEDPHAIASPQWSPARCHRRRNPQIEEGRHPIRRVIGDDVVVRAAIFADGKDELAARLLFRHSSERRWSFAPMQRTDDDLWRGSFHVDKIGDWRFTLLGWVDHFASWAGELKKRIAAQNDAAISDVKPGATPGPDAGLNAEVKSGAADIALALRSGAQLIDAAAKRTRGNDAKRLRELAGNLEELAARNRSNYDNPCNDELMQLMRSYSYLTNATRYEIDFPGWTDLDLDKIGCSADESFVVDDLLNDRRYTWHDHNYVALPPGVQPAHIFRVSRIQ